MFSKKIHIIHHIISNYIIYILYESGSAYATPNHSAMIESSNNDSITHIYQMHIIKTKSNQVMLLPLSLNLQTILHHCLWTWLYTGLSTSCSLYSEHSRSHRIEHWRQIIKHRSLYSNPFPTGVLLVLGTYDLVWIFKSFWRNL